MAGGAGVEHRLAAGGHPDLLPQLVGGDRLEQVAGRAGGHGRHHQRLVVVGGQDQHPGLGVLVEDRPQGLDPVETGHRVVAEHEVGRLAGGEEGGVGLDEGLPVAHRGDDADAVVGGEPVHDGLEHQPVVLGDDQADGRRGGAAGRDHLGRHDRIIRPRGSASSGSFGPNFRHRSGFITPHRRRQWLTRRSDHGHGRIW